ncbi:hypothetical protein T4D_8982 [Trichinella pseudospiralis]|uniref:Uncharacterized protein n=1 Tax=Trichinella pseudospiralis TaxID=6337 RepID=A0A0V1G496_TRIPS|nr:hypothetical protein T4D_8982 [Trichinella pseudospiralis]
MLMFMPDDLVQKKPDMDFNPIHMKLYSGMFSRVACRVGVGPRFFLVENSVAILSKMEPSVFAALVACSRREQCNQTEHKQVAHLRRSERNAPPICLVEKYIYWCSNRFQSRLMLFIGQNWLRLGCKGDCPSDRLLFGNGFLMARKYSGQSVENGQSAQKYICTMAIWQ